MTAFDKAFEYVVDLEGLYATDSDDPGGETFYGISRVHWPSWKGWEYIDRLGAAGALSDQSVMSFVKHFYRDNFWYPLQCPAIAIHSEVVATEVFEAAVNVGTHRAAIFLQEGLNLMNVNQSLYYDVTTDGIIGARTLEALGRYYASMTLRDSADALLVGLLNVLQGAYYVRLMKKHPQYEKYRGWFRRIIPRVPST